MAFSRTASALVVQPSISPRGWGKVRTASKVQGQPSKDLTAQASEILGKNFDPKDYLLTHVTIVASVTVFPVPGIKLGMIKEGSQSINRKWAEYLITPETDPYINNNHDSFSREVVKLAYNTFIGAQNYQEHVQIPEMSKGRILDAVLRDIGDTLYVDILVATDRKHAQLVKDIEDGCLNTLSMGCSVDATQCTKCGHVAADETELCPHIRYEKGNYFLDEQGTRRRVAELCGHPSMGRTGGVTYIEASWVGAPAFTGAVMRNIIHPANLSEKQATRMQEILGTPPCEWTDSCGIKKAASEIQDEATVVGKVGDRGIVSVDWDALPDTITGTLTVGKPTPHKVAFDFGDGGDDGGGDDAAPEAPKEEPSPLHQLEEDVLKEVVERVKTRVRDELDKSKKQDEPSPEDDSTAPNDSIIKEARRIAASRLAQVRVATAKKAYQQAYWAAVATLTKTATSDADLVNSVAVLDDTFGMQIPQDAYRVALKVGSADKYQSVGEFLSACKKATGHPISSQAARTLIRLGKILSYAEAFPPPAYPNPSK